MLILYFNNMEMFLTVIIRVYNRDKCVERCLNSVINQTFINRMQVLIIDDCSTDNSIEIINNIIDNHNDLCIDLVRHNKNMGRGKALNTAKKYVKGKYCCILDSDDIYNRNSWVEEIYNEIGDNEYDIIYNHNNGNGNFHVNNIYLSSLYKICPICNINYYEDHYDLFWFKGENIRKYIYKTPRYLNIIGDESGRSCAHHDTDFRILFEDVFFHKKEKDKNDLIFRALTYDTNKFDDSQYKEVLMESYNEILKELKITDDMLLKYDNIRKFNRVNITVGYKINNIYSVVKIPKCDENDLFSGINKNLINIDNIKKYRPEQAVCIIRDPLEKAYSIYKFCYADKFNTFDEYIDNLKTKFNDKNNLEECIRPQYRFFNYWSIDEFIFLEDYDDWRKEHNIPSLEINKNLNKTQEEISEYAINTIKELYKDDYELIDIIKEYKKIYINKK